MRHGFFNRRHLREHHLRLRHHFFPDLGHGDILHTALKQRHAQFFF